MIDMEKQWKQVGTLNGRPIYESNDGKLAIERAFEVLCELSEEELQLWCELQTEAHQNGGLEKDTSPTEL